MPLQNRVDPWGNLNAISAKGAWLGNRGILHNNQKQLVAQWRHSNWVTCVLEYKGRRREIFSPNNYSELFFLDEATALSAGHRPCAECRSKRYREFKEFWCKANHLESVTSRELDKQLHAERAIRGGGKAVFEAEFVNLPSGTFIELEGKALLHWSGNLYSWSATGYTLFEGSLEPSKVVTVLTPFSIVGIFRLGFTPQVHESVCS